MPLFLSDPETTTYVLLGVLAAIAGGVWFRRRTRPLLIAFAALALLLAGLALCDFLVESPREESVRKIKAMADGANARQWDATFSHVSEQFKFRDFTKPKFRDWASRAAPQFDARVSFNDFDRQQAKYLPNDEVQIGCAAAFTGNVGGAGRVAVYLRLTFGRDADGQYRLRGIKAYDFIQRETEVSFPGM